MPIFKYKVTNSSGKNLSGTVEAPNEQIARTELNNMGFSIVSLDLTTEMPKVDKSLKKYVFEAIDQNSKLITGTIPAKDEEDAYNKLGEGYSLNITAIWEEGASEDAINNARDKGAQKHQNTLESKKNDEIIQLESEEKQQQNITFVKSKIDQVLKEVDLLLTKYNADFEPAAQREIDKKVNKVLRIKNSTNLEYILKAAEDLLLTITKQADRFKESGQQEKQLSLEIDTKKILGDLTKTQGKVTLKEDILDKINKWQKTHESSTSSAPNKIIGNILIKVRQQFTTPEHIKIIRNQIKSYNEQLIDYVKLYFKEPTKEYKDKVKKLLKETWASRKKAVHSLKYTQQFAKRQNTVTLKESSTTFLIITKELNSLSGWILTLYVIYYFVGINITTIDFGLSTIPKGFEINSTHIFKYLLIILFLLHSSTALYVNFFRKNIYATIILPIAFVTLSLITILNF